MPVKVTATTVDGKRRWAVVEVETGRVVKSYPSKADAMAYAAALNIAYAKKHGKKKR